MFGEKQTFLPKLLFFSFHDRLVSLRKGTLQDLYCSHNILSIRQQVYYSVRSLLELELAASLLSCVCVCAPNVSVCVPSASLSLLYTHSAGELDLCVYVCSWQPPRGRASLFFFTFRLIKQFRNLRGLHLEAKDPVNARLRCWKPRALLANICSHCELLACNTSSTRRKHTVARTHTRSQNHHAGTNLSFLFHWWVSGSQWETLAPAVLSA